MQHQGQQGAPGGNACWILSQPIGFGNNSWTMSISDAAARLLFRQALPCRRARSTTQRPASEGDMPKYLLVARDSGDWTQVANSASPAEMQAVLGKYKSWSDRVAAQGKL